VEATHRRHRENWADEAYVEDWLGRQPARAAERETHFRLIRSLIPHTADEVFSYINLGAGDGWLDEFILERFGRATATLLDGSALMGERAQERLHRFADRVRTIRADLSTSQWIAVAGSGYDLAVSSIALHNLRDPLRIRDLYREVYGLLADGAMFLNFDYVRLANPELRPLVQLAGTDAEAPFSQTIRGGHGGAPGTIEEQLVWMREAGFSLVDCFWKEFDTTLFGGFKGAARVPTPV